MKTLQLTIATILCVSLLSSCSDTNATITNAVKIAVHEAIHNVPAEFQQPLSDYMMVTAKAVYSINGEPTVQELVATVLKWIPKDIQDKFPLIITAVTTTITLMYVTYGKSGLTAIGLGIEAGATPPF